MLEGDHLIYRRVGTGSPYWSACWKGITLLVGVLEDYPNGKRDRRSTLSVGVLEYYCIGRRVGKSTLLPGVLEDYCIG